MLKRYYNLWLKEKAKNKELKKLIRQYKRHILMLLDELQENVKDMMNTKEL